MKIINVVGARPNFMKIAPLVEEMDKHPQIEAILVHTEQHYDENMSQLFFNQLKLPKPDICLGVGSLSHAQQTANIMIKFEEVLLNENPDLVIVVGDVNSTIACALTAVKLNIPVAHVEAGLRSFDRKMPEEINRILTDAISDYLFITETSAQVNLLNEGVSKEKIFFVGNVMIDTLLKYQEKSKQSKILDTLELKSGEYALLTLHRPSNVDNKETLVSILKCLEQINEKIKIVYPIHPRTKKNIENFGLANDFPFLAQNNSEKKFLMTEPLGYLDFMRLMSEAKLVLTDSGGIQEETTVLGVPCVTLRENTERPVTVLEGTNTVTGTAQDKIIKATVSALESSDSNRKIPQMWDGLASQRIVKILLDKYKLL